MALWQVLILAVVQGVTEFLPISSSGHLVIVAALTGATTDVVDVNIVLHVGTLGSILVFYWRRIFRLFGEDRRVLGLVAVGTIPAVGVGALVETMAPTFLASPLVAGCLLPVTGLLLLWASRSNRPAATTGGGGSQSDSGPPDPSQPGTIAPIGYTQSTWTQTLLIGASQAIAILPGVSRSGATISAGIRLGLRADAAATFSFLLAIPIMLGAGAYEAFKHFSRDAAQWEVVTPPSHLAIGAIVSFAVGLASLKVLVKVLERGKIQWFAWWCIPVGAAVIVWQLTIL